jgi:outer membrane biogenesis lipoprotein LolB
MFNSSKILFLLIFIANFYLYGCASPAQQAASQRQKQWQAEQNQRNAYQSLVNKCEGYGFKSGTTAFAQCLQQAEQQVVIENAMRAQHNYQSQQQQQQQQFKKAQCYFSGKWDC